MGHVLIYNTASDLPCWIHHQMDVLCFIWWCCRLITFTAVSVFIVFTLCCRRYKTSFQWKGDYCCVINTRNNHVDAPSLTVKEWEHRSEALKWEYCSFARCFLMEKRRLLKLSLTVLSSLSTVSIRPRKHKQHRLSKHSHSLHRVFYISIHFWGGPITVKSV